MHALATPILKRNLVNVQLELTWKHGDVGRHSRRLTLWACEARFDRAFPRVVTTERPRWQSRFTDHKRSRIRTVRVL